MVQRLGELLGRVQTTSPFPRFVEYPDIVARLWAHVCRTGLFAPGVLDAHTERLERIRELYVWDPNKSVSSHNDPVPRNILFDGERLWLIDWESAYRNDPLVDVAIVLDNLAPSPELAGVLLQAWLGRPADEALCAQLALIRALTRLYYAGVLLSASGATASRALPDNDFSAPTLPEYRLAIREGRLKPGAPETKHILGKMFLASFFSGVAPPGTRRRRVAKLPAEHARRRPKRPLAGRRFVHRGQDRGKALLQFGTPLSAVMREHVEFVLADRVQDLRGDIRRIEPGLSEFGEAGGQRASRACRVRGVCRARSALAGCAHSPRSEFAQTRDTPRSRRYRAARPVSPTPLTC